MKFEDVNSKESQGESQGSNGSNQSSQSGSSDGFNVSNIEIKELNGVVYEKKVTETRELGQGQVIEQTVISKILIPQANGEFVGRSSELYCTTHRELLGELYVMSPDRSVWCYVCGEPTCIRCAVLLSDGRVSVPGTQQVCCHN